MLIQTLIQNGFSHKEAALYLAVLEGGELTLAQAAKKANLKRSTVYSLVIELKKKGILSLMKQKGIQYISALPPRLLIEHLESSVEAAKSYLPELIHLAYASPIKPRIYFHEGLEGIKHILFDAASCKRDYIGFIDYTLMPKEVYEYIRSKVAPQREKDNTQLRLLMPLNEINKKVFQEYTDHVQHKMIRFPSGRNHIEILLYENSKIGFLSFAKKEMFGVVIDSEAIYQTLYDLFEYIWNIETINK